MATFSQLPGTLNLEFKQGDDVAVAVDFSVALTGYTVAASIISLVNRATIATPTVTVTDAATGAISVGLTGEQTTAMAAGTYKWFVYWDAPGPTRRTALEGIVEVVR
jgi:hypothetical protein